MGLPIVPTSHHTAQYILRAQEPLDQEFSQPCIIRIKCINKVPAHATTVPGEPQFQVFGTPPFSYGS